MKSKNALVAALITLAVLTVVGLDYHSAYRKYNQLRADAGSPVMQLKAIGRKEQRFFEEVRRSWMAFEPDETEEGLLEICEMLQFEPTVEGLVLMCTHEVPPFALFDKEQNLREAGRAGALSQIHESSFDGVIYYKKGVAYLKYRENMIDCFEDTGDGVKYTIYGRKKETGDEAVSSPNPDPNFGE